MQFLPVGGETTQMVSRNLCLSGARTRAVPEPDVKGGLLDVLDVLPVFQVPLWTTCGAAWGWVCATLGEGS